MSRNPLKISVLVLLTVMLGCGYSGDVQVADNMEPSDPLKKAFDEKELGKPMDLDSLNEKDKAFVSALEERDSAKAKAALAAGAKADIDCGYGCTTLMLAAATGDSELVETMKKAGAKVTPDAEPYLEILNFAKNAEDPKFKAALAEIANLTGSTPLPEKRPGAYRIGLSAEAAKTFLEKHHTRLLDNGCYVFLYDQNFGYGKPDGLWILPTKNKFAVMAFTGVDGVNYGLDNHLIIRWMKKLDKDQPYFLTGCGQDFLSGRFVSKLTDTDAMAKRMYEFCPDIVDQGTNTVEDLAKELRDKNELYFWWD